MSNRNTNAHFELAPQVETERSTMDRSFDVKTSFNVGELIPFYVDEILPGDSVKIQTTKVARLQTLLTPVMDNLFLDVYYFFVPNRLVWSHWVNMCGENTTGHWVPQLDYTVPGVQVPDEAWETNTIANYMGIPFVAKDDASLTAVNALPFRAYAKIVNDWFIDENLQDPANIPMGDSLVYGSSGSNYVTDLVKGGRPFIANKTHDYFTSCLPGPQKGEAVSLLSGYAPVLSFGFTTSEAGMGSSTYSPKMKSRLSTGDTASGYLCLDDSGVVNVDEESVIGESLDDLVFTNLFADLSKTKTYKEYGSQHWNRLTINDLRRAFAVQRILEKDARSGSRYIETLKAHFGVTSPDYRLQRSEYLGGNRCPLNIEQVVQTNPTSGSPLGHLAAYSQTADQNFDVNKSFTEHGYIIGLCCARYDHTYQQGLERMWTRETRFDFYWPALAHLGEKAVYNYEIYYGTENDEDIFGYQEAWAEYRYKPNRVTGQMSGNTTSSLKNWHFADIYNQLPTLSSAWIKEDKSNVDRTLAVTSATADQIFADILVSATWTRPLPLYSIPGLIDHF